MNGFGPENGIELLHAPLDPLQKCILMDYFERVRQAQPLLPLRELAILLHVSPHTIERAVVEMETAGYILARRVRGKQTVYLAAYPAIPPMHPRRSAFVAAFEKEYQNDTPLPTSDGGEKQSQNDTPSEKQSQISPTLPAKEDVFDTPFAEETEKQSRNDPTPWDEEQKQSQNDTPLAEITGSLSPDPSPSYRSRVLNIPFSDSLLIDVPGAREEAARVSSEQEQLAWEAFLAAYPKRCGDRKVKAGREKFARLARDGIDLLNAIQAGVERYREWAEATGKTGTELVQQITTWLNADNWKLDWAIPDPSESQRELRSSIANANGTGNTNSHSGRSGGQRNPFDGDELGAEWQRKNDEFLAEQRALRRAREAAQGPGG